MSRVLAGEGAMRAIGPGRAPLVLLTLQRRSLPSPALATQASQSECVRSVKGSSSRFPHRPSHPPPHPALSVSAVCSAEYVLGGETRGLGLLSFLLPLAWFGTFTLLVIFNKWLVIGTHVQCRTPLSTRFVARADFGRFLPLGAFAHAVLMNASAGFSFISSSAASISWPSSGLCDIDAFVRYLLCRG